MNETITRKMTISGGNLSDKFKATYQLEIEIDLTREQELEEIGASLTIKHQKDRDNVSEKDLTARQVAGVYKVKASKLIEKRKTTVVRKLTNDEIVAGIKNGTIVLTPEQKKEIAEFTKN